MKVSFAAPLAIALLLSSAALAQDKASQKFLTDAIEGNLAEVQMGQLAQKSATREDVRSFGKMLETDHSQANTKAKSAASQLGVTPPTSPNAKQKTDYDRMSKLSGARFDEEFIKHMVADHKKDVSEYEQEAKKKDAAGAYASEALPTLRKHLETVQSLSASNRTGQRSNPHGAAVMATPAPATGVPAPKPELSTGQKAPPAR